MLVCAVIVSFIVMSKGMQPGEEETSFIPTDVLIYGKRFQHEHNNWDHLRSVRGRKQLQCRVCGQRLRLLVSAASTMMHTVDECQKDNLPCRNRLNIYRWNVRPTGWHQELRKDNGKHCFQSGVSETADEEWENASAPTIDCPEGKYANLFQEFSDFQASSEQRISELEGRVMRLEQAQQYFTTM